jgi:hypothetical protein
VFSARYIHSTPYVLRSILILFSLLRLCLPSGFFLLDFVTYILHAFHSSRIPGSLLLLLLVVVVVTVVVGTVATAAVVTVLVVAIVVVVV